jgi:hypothetical protein
MAWEILVLAEYNVLSMSNQTIDLGSWTQIRVREFAMQYGNQTDLLQVYPETLISEGMKIMV